ncbi:MAG: hypothetical protein AAFO74_05245 [Pseudomonadota bacterium]
MFVNWPDHSETRFGSDVLMAKHDVSKTELFTDEGLAHLLDVYPRENLDIWTFGQEGEGVNSSLRGRAPELPGSEIVEAVKQGHIWLNMRRANILVPDLAPISDVIFDSLEGASGNKARKRDVSVLISSPNVKVHYHLDIPLVALFQMRGRKKVWMYPRSEEKAPSEFIEDIVHMTREEELPYLKVYDEDATVYELEPGLGVTWPQFMPHRVENEDCMNVSLSCEFQTLNSFVHANAIYTNKLLRQLTSLAPKARAGISPLTYAKAAFARVHKAAAKQGPRVSPTPVTFELDTSVESCIRPLYI